MITDEMLCVYGNRLAESNDEVVLRNSVGRSYYAAYHRACSWYESSGLQQTVIEGKGVHASMIQNLKRPLATGHLRSTSAAVGHLLEILKRARTKADYRLEVAVDRREALRASELARRLLVLTEDAER